MIDAAKIAQALRCDNPVCGCQGHTPRAGGIQYTLHCPAHDDAHPSLSLMTYDGKVLAHCFSGCAQDAVIHGLRARSLWAAAPAPSIARVAAAPASSGLTVTELAQAKKLPIELLCDFGATDTQLSGTSAVSIPYLNAEGETVAVRYRLAMAKEEQRFAWRAGDHPHLYGLNRLAEIRQAGWVLLVEGESDVWTLWYHGLPALGIPGKSIWRNEWAAHLSGIQVFVWQEPDAADLVNRLTAAIPDLRVIVAPSGIKDPSEAHLLNCDLSKFIPKLKAAASQYTKKVESANSAQAPQTPISLYTSNELLHTKYPDPVWAVPGLLPVGLTILAGAPKIGKSWLALQIALSVASGGMTFNEPVTRGAVLYLALEDSPRRLQTRMKQQKWSDDLPAHFMCLGNFESQIGDLRNGGGEKLSNCIERGGYRFVVIDTLSRAVHGDQNDAYEMTRELEPLHRIANDNNVALLLIDHHRKTFAENADAIADILGSTAKGAVPDTLLGLYRERGKRGAKLHVTGRDIEEQTLALSMDWVTGCWQLDGEAGEIEMTERRREIMDVLKDQGCCTPKQIADAVGQDRHNTRKRLVDMVNLGVIVRTGDRYALSTNTDTPLTPATPEGKEA